MTTYVVGDVQGCHASLVDLLQRVKFQPERDALWFTGDLVNRGPDSLAVLRLAQRLNAVTVLGNHDLHLLAVAAGAVPKRKRDTLDAVLAAPDAPALLDWLAQRPLMHEAEGVVLVHAGLLPQWDLPLARECARAVEATLRGPERVTFLTEMYGDAPDRWDPGLDGWARLRLSVNAFTRLRYCRRDGSCDFSFKGPPGQQPADLLPWFEMPARRHAGTRIVFGHWSALGLYRGADVTGLDSGCLWGGRLTALRLDDGEALSVSCLPYRSPGWV